MKNKTIHISRLILFAAVFCFWFNQNSFSQTIVAAEYFFNTDPGVGNGTPFSISSGNDITTNLTIPTIGLNPGFNHLFIRHKNNLGKWSLYQSQTIFIKSNLAPTTQIYKGEYFFDTDPGVGNATPISITSGNDITVSFPINTTSLSHGFHALFFRTKDLAGKWSLYNDRIIYIVNSIPNHKLVYGEYFFNTDTAFGSGVPFSFTPVDNKVDTFIINTTALPAGVNKIAFRFRDSIGVYSLNAAKSFRICDYAALANFSADTVCLGQDSTIFNNLSTGGDTLTIYKWDFDGNGTIDYQTTGTIGHGTPAQFRYKYTIGGTLQCKLITDNGGGCSDTIIKPVVVISYPPPHVPIGTSGLCINSPNSTYTIPAIQGATSYTWYLSPINAGVLTFQDTTAVIDWDNTFVGTVQLTVKADHGTCTSNQSAPSSPSLTITISSQTIAGTISLAQSSICEGSSTGNITLTGYIGTIIKWQKRHNNGSWNDIPSNSPVLSETPSSGGIWDYRAIVKNAACDTAFSNYATITVYPKPSPAGTIDGTPLVCEGQYQVAFSVPAITGATNYTWTLPLGATISSGGGTNSILVNFSMGANSGPMYVFGSNTCGIGYTSPTFPITVKPSPIANAGNDLLVWYGTSDTLTGSAFGGTPPYSYTWSPTSLLLNANMQNPITKPMFNSTPFTLIATDSLGCTGADQVNVIVYGQPLSATPIADPSIICQGSSSQLNVLPGGGSGNYTYSWSSNPSSSFTSTLQNPVVTPTATTQYIVIINDGSQTLSASTTITISPKPATAGTITGSNTVCREQSGIPFSVPLIPNASGYIWQYPAGSSIFSGSNTNNIVLDFGSNAVSGVVTVLGTNMCGSGLPSANFSVTVNALPLADAGPSQYIAIGSHTTLHGLASNGSGNYSYAWSPAIQLINANIQNPLTDTLTNSTSFTLTVTDNVTGCQNTATVLVLVTGFPLSATTTAVPATICQGDSSEINALPSGGTGTYSYAWSSNPAGFTSTSQNPTVSPSITTEYIVTVSAGGQTNTSNVIVTVSPIPIQPGTITGDNVVCRGETSVLYSVPVVPGANNYNWSLPPGASIYSGNGTNSILVNYSLLAIPGIVKVNVSNFCGTSPYSNNYPVTVNLLPNASAGNDTVLASGGYANLIGTASGGSGNYSFAWSPAILLDNGSIPYPTTIPLSNSHTFILTVTDNVTGCVNSSSMQAIITGGALTATANATPQTICEGSSTQINALPQGGQSPYSYSWTSVPAGFYSTIKNPIVSPIVNTEYFVAVQDVSQQTFASVAVTINPLPDTAGIITGDAQVCQGEAGVLFSVPTIANASSGYIWTLPSGVILASGSNTNTITLNLTQAALSGTITVVGNNFCGVGAPSQFQIHVDSIPQVNAGADAVIAQNATTQLNGSATGGSGNFSYSWSPTSILNSPNTPNPTTTPLASSALFTLVVTDNVTGCQNSDQVQVIVSGVPLSVSADATPPTVCQGAQSMLYALPTGGTGNYSYTWSSLPVGLNSNTQNPTVIPTVTTVYTVVCSDGAQTAMSATTVTLSSLPGAAGQISGPTSVCRGENGASFSIPLIPGASSYAWSLPSGVTIASGANTNSINVNFSLIASSGLISVYGLNTCGNGTASSYQITVNPLPIANAGPDMAVGQNSDTTLHGTATGGFGTYNYTWAPAILLVNPNIQNPNTVSLFNPTTFYLTVTDATSGCKGTDDLTIYIFGGPLSLGATASPSNICQGQSSSLNAIPTGGSGIYTYNWTSTPILFTSSLQNPIVSPTVTTTYHLTVNDGTNNATTSVIVTVNPLPSTPGVITGTNEVCQGTNSIIYNVTPVNGATSYNWTLPSGASIIAGQGTNSITVNFSSSAVSGLIKVNGINLCGSGSFSPGFQITVNPSPVVNAGIDQNIVSGNSTSLLGTVYGGIGPFTYLWSPIMFFSPQSQAQLLNPTTNNLSSSVIFTLTVLDSTSGCSAFDQVIVYTSGDYLTLSASATPTNICQGQTSQLNALPSGGSGTYQYLWSSFPGGNFTSTLQNPVVSPTVTTQYLVVVHDDTDSVSQTIVVTVNPQPDSAGTITGTSPVCQGATGVMFTVPPIANATSYVWSYPSPDFTVASGNGTNTIYLDVANDAVSGSISVYGINTCGVGSASPYYSANVSLTPFAYTSPDRIIPADTAIQLFGYAILGSGSYTYTWQPAQLLVDNNAQNPMTVDLTQSAIFTLIVTDNVTGCQSTDQIQIIVYGGALSVATSSDLYSICSGTSVQLNALPTGGDGLYTYSWTPYIGLSDATISNPVATPNITTEYIVEITSVGITATNSVLITVYPQPGNAGTITGTSTVCQGETNVLFTVPPIANATNYYWTVPYGATIISGSNTNTIMVNFSLTATSGNITVYGGNICGFGNSSANFFLTINPIPTIYAGADQQISSGLDASLSGVVSGGSGVYDYLWTPANFLNPNNDTLIDPITIPLTASHIFTFTVTDSITGCINSDYMKVIVCGGNLTVLGFASNNNICQGQTTYLDALPSGGNCVTGSYNWTSIPTGFSSTLVNPAATPSVSITYIVSYNDGSNTATYSVPVNVNPLVGNAGQIQGPSSVCQNSGTVTYSIPPIVGAESYVWTFPQGTVFTSNPDSNVVEVIYTNFAVSGFISVYGTSLCGFGLASPLFPITVKPLPPAAGQIVGPSYMSKGNTAQFTVPAIPGVYTYNWVLPFGAIITSGQGTNSITVEFTDTCKSGFIYVYGINSCGTGDPSSVHLLTIITSLAELYGIELKLYPNPSNGEFFLDLNGDPINTYDLKVMNLFGSEVYKSVISQKQNRLDLSHLPNGMYYMVLTNDKVKIVEKFVIVK